MNDEDLEKVFLHACEKMKSLSNLDNESKLKIYGLFKIATEGVYNSDKDKEIGFFDFEKKYKYQSWKSLSNKYNSLEAKIEYINMYYTLAKVDLPNFLSEIKNKEKTVEKNSENEEDIFSMEDLEIINQQNFFGSESNAQFSSTAKISKDEIKDFLEKASNNECAFFEIQKYFREKKNITPEFFKQYSHLDCKFFQNLNIISADFD
jgi:acyl-CoA-binding protein